MAQHSKSKKYVILCIILALILIAAASIIIFQRASTRVNIEIPNFLVISQLSTKGYMKVAADAAVVGNEGVITLTGDCYQLIANTEATQAESIYNGLGKKIDFRPNTHDLMKDELDIFGTEVLMVKIVDLKNNTFISNLILKQENKIVSLDCRPSDAIALAVRTESPIYIKEDLMKSEGEYIC